MEKLDQGLPCVIVSALLRQIADVFESIFVYLISCFMSTIKAEVMQGRSVT